MGRYVDKDNWEEEVLIPDTHTPILGGQPVWEGDRLVDGFANVSAAILADRTRHLKNKVDGIEIGLDTNFENFMRKDDNLSDLEDIQQAKYNLELNLVDNTRDLDKPISDDTQEALDEKVDLVDPRLSDSRTPKGPAGGVLSGSYPNPTFSVDMATQAELDAVEAAKVDKVAGKGLSDENYTLAEKNKLGGIETGAQVNTVTSVAGKTGDVTLNKSDVGLSNVDNTSDSNKPVSTAQQAALDLKLNANANAVSASKLATPRTISLSGDVSGSTSFDGSANATIEVQVADDSHNHVISNVDGLQTALDSKVDKVVGKELSTNDFTDQLRDKLASLESSHFRGTFPSKGELEIAIPVAEAGDYADVDTAGQDAERYIWDSSDSIWVLSTTKPAPLTAAQIKQMYESNPDTNPFDDAAEAKLGGIADGATKNATDAQLRARSTHTGTQPISTISGLEAELTDKVSISDTRLTNSREWTAATVSQAEAEAGTATTRRAWTAQRVRQAILGWWNTSTFKTKLDGIATGATKNSTDAQLRDRATHTGTQEISTVAGLATSLDSKADQTSLDAVDASKVDKVAGKGLSTNDFTTAEKNKLSGVQAGAQVNSITTVNGKTGAVTLTYTDVNAAPTTHTHPLSQITGAGDLASLSTNDSTTSFLRGDGTWATPPNTNTTYVEIPTSEIDAGTASTSRAITGRRMKYALDKKADVSHTHTLSQITDAGSVASISTNGSSANFLRGDGTWVTPPNTNTTYAEITTAEIDAGTASTLRTISGRRMKYALDKKSNTGHGHAIGDVTGLQTALDSKANTSTQVIAGTGLSGGGTLAANRTLSVNYGTSAGTAAQGNDSRLSNSREWTASVVPQAEAETGTATTARKWTAQRVRQAIVAWFNGVSGALGRTILTRTTAAQVRSDIGLGTAATADLTTSRLDGTDGRVLRVGDGGWMGRSRGHENNYDYPTGLNDDTNRTKVFVDGYSSYGVPGNSAGFHFAGYLSWGRLRVSRDTSNAWVQGGNANEGTGWTSQVVLSANLLQTTGTSAEFPMSQAATTSQLAARANTSTQVIAGTGLSGGGTLAANRTLNVQYGTAAGTAAQGNDSRIVNAVPNSRQIISGTGLSGGGTLAANRTLSVTYGTTAGTAAQGNDSRIVNAVPNTRQVIAGTGLSGGGNLTTNRTLSVNFGTASGTVKQGNWQPTTASKAQVLNGTANAFVTGTSYHNVISWNTTSHSSGTATLNLNTSLNHILNITGSVTIGAPSNATLGKTGDIVLRVNANVVVGWNTRWKFLGSVPDIGANGEVWVVSYKVLSSTEIIAAASKVV